MVVDLKKHVEIQNVSHSSNHTAKQAVTLHSETLDPAVPCQPPTQLPPSAASPLHSRASPNPSKSPAKLQSPEQPAFYTFTLSLHRAGQTLSQAANGRVTLTTALHTAMFVSIPLTYPSKAKPDAQTSLEEELGKRILVLLSVEISKSTQVSHSFSAAPARIGLRRLAKATDKIARQNCAAEGGHVRKDPLMSVRKSSDLRNHAGKSR